MYYAILTSHFILFLIDIQKYKANVTRNPGVEELMSTVTKSEALLLKDFYFAFVLFGTAHFQTDDVIKSKRLEQSIKILEKLLKSELDAE